MHFMHNNQVVILTVVTTMKVHDTIIDEIHLVMSKKIEKNNAVIQISHDRIIQNIEEFHGVKIKKVIEFTDGCSSQYKCRKFFGWLAERKIEDNPKLMRIYWESGHGKSKGDGAGGTIKVQLDRAVYGQHHIFESPEHVFQYCQENLSYNKDTGRTRRRVFYFQEGIELEKDFKTVKGKTKNFQLLFCNSNY